MTDNPTADVDLIQSADPEAIELDIIKETSKKATDDGQESNSEEPGSPVAEKQDDDKPETIEATESEEGEAEAEQPERKSRAAERIHQLHSQMRNLEAALSAKEREVTGLQEKLQQQPQLDPDDYDGQQAARYMQMQRADMLNDGVGQYQEMARQRNQMLAQTFDAKCEAAADRLPGVAQKVASLPTLSHTTFELMTQSPNTAEIANFLGSNPMEAAKLAAMTDVKQAFEIARLESRFSKAPKPRKVSSAPNPPPKVTPKSGAAQKDPAEMTPKEYAAWRGKGGGS